MGKYAILNFCKETATGRGGNTQVIMEETGDGLFSVTEGQIGIKYGRQRPKKYTRPMGEWEEFMSMKINTGYLLYSSEKLEKKEVSQTKSGYKPLENPAVKEIVEKLLAYAQKCMEENFTISVTDIPDEMLERGKKILDELATGYRDMSLAVFNNKLKTLFMSLPRRIPDINKKLAKRNSDFNDIIAEEQELYDLMLSQVRQGKMDISSSKTILEAFGIEIEPVTQEEEGMIKQMMNSVASRYHKAWRVKNLATESRFNAYCEKENLTEKKGISHLFHGSRSENFWSIITNGLTINPTGVVITGKAFGNGTYFAPDAIKSAGYTSVSGSKWANGNQKYAYMGIYKVATGKRYNASRGCDSSLNWNKLQQICPGAHCTWAERRYSGFMMDEVIVYQDCQSTVEYLVEISA